jgi:hypothetical protein
MMVHAYEVAGPSAEQTTAEVNEALEPLHFFPTNLQVAPTPHHVRVRFECEGTRNQQKSVLQRLQECGKFEAVTHLGPVHTE